MNNLFTYSTILFFLYLSQKPFAQEDQTSLDLFSPESRLKFGNFLFNSEDYLRATIELKEYLNFEKNDTVFFKVGYALSKIGRREDAKEIFKELFNNDFLSGSAQFEFCKANFLEGDFNSLRNFQLAENLQDISFRKNISKLANYSYLLDTVPLPDSSMLFSDSNSSKIKILRDFYSRKMNPGYKSPMLAAVLSTVLPGAGKIYADQTGDGITAFLLTGLFGFLAYDNFRADHKTRAWVFTGLTAFFYGGNIYGSAAAAHIYNAGIKINLDNEINVYIEQQNYFSPNYDF